MKRERQGRQRRYLPRVYLSQVKNDNRVKRDWEGRGELCVCRDQLVERNQMKGKKPETGEE